MMRWFPAFGRSLFVRGALRSILRKTSGIPGAIREGLEPRAKDIKFACIYGSVAKGTSRGASDMDLLVVGTLSFADLVQLPVQIEARLGREISPRLYAPGNFGSESRAMIVFSPRCFVAP
jgi:predicted nucleotidyltransferase